MTVQYVSAKRSLPAIGLAAIVFSSAAERGVAQPNRAAPPTFPDEVRQAFIEDFRNLLEGDRPREDLSENRPAANNSGAQNAASEFQWSRLVDADALTTEVKRVFNGLPRSIGSSASFRSGGHIQAKQDFGILALLFGVIAKFDQEIRFQQAAPLLMHELSRASEACEEATDESLASAIATKQRLEDVMRGQRIRGDVSNETPMWSDLASRPLIMQRMEQMVEERIDAPLADARAFRRSEDDVRHEAQLLAVLAEIIQRQEYDFWDDETYVDYAADLRSAALLLATATENGDLAAAREAVKAVRQSCTECHEGYR